MWGLVREGRGLRCRRCCSLGYLGEVAGRLSQGGDREACLLLGVCSRRTCGGGLVRGGTFVRLAVVIVRPGA